MSYQFNYHEYKNRIKPKPTGSISVIVIFIIILLGLAYFFQPRSKKAYEFYFVEVNSYLNYTEANNMANTIQQSGGAGYVYFNGRYHVLASFYPSEADARSVCENLKSDYPNAKIFTIEADDFARLKNLTREQNELIEKTIADNKNLIAGLYTAITKYESNEIDMAKFTLTLRTLKNDYNETYSRFSTKFKNNVKLTALSNIHDINDEINTLCDDLSTDYRFRYRLISIVINHYSFLVSF